jgi:hypothetical protein
LFDALLALRDLMRDALVQSRVKAQLEMSRGRPFRKELEF